MIKLKISPDRKLNYKEFCNELDNPKNHLSSKDYLVSQIRYFEHLYKIDSKVFYNQFVNGQLPDKYDYTKWAFFWRTYSRLYAPSKGGKT